MAMNFLRQVIIPFMTTPPSLARLAPLAVAVALLIPVRASQAPAPAPLERPGEKHLRNIRQLTNGSENAEAYFSFAGFPMYSPDGRTLVFASNRHDAKQGETNIFVADWVK
jgi:hypothetical protein